MPTRQELLTAGAVQSIARNAERMAETLERIAERFPDPGLPPMDAFDKAVIATALGQYVIHLEEEEGDDEVSDSRRRAERLEALFVAQEGR